MSDYLASWPTESPPDELTEAGLQFARLLRRAGVQPSDELLAWIARRGAQRVLWDSPLRP
jgi:hypothetical protein